MATAVTIYDIAKQANVSIATVSRVFNKSPRVSEATRARILQLADELGYQPNHSARSLARQVVPLVSAVIPMMTSYFYLEVLQGVQDQISESEFDLIVYSAPSMEGVDGQLRAALQKGRASGTLLFSTMLTEDRIRLLSESQQPVALVDRCHEAFDSVSLDNERGGFLATKHLIDIGRRRIGLLQAHPESRPSIDRRKGYERALREAGQPLDISLIEAQNDIHFHGFTEESGYRSVQRLLKRGADFDALFAMSDIQALGAMRALRETGRTMPDDVALVGFDDVMISRHVGLTTLSQPMYAMGQTATHMLLDRMSEPDRPVQQELFEPALVVRGSTNPALSLISGAGHAGA